MKKVLLLLTACVFLATGCQIGSRPDAGGESAGDTGQSGFPSSQAVDKSLPDYDLFGLYYKMEMTPAVYDVDSILNCLIPGYDKSRVQREGEDYSIELDGIKHTWYLGKKGFGYSNDSSQKRALTEKEALAYSDAFIKQAGFQVAEHPTILGQEHGMWENKAYYEITYEFQYKDVPILGESYIDLKNGDDENSFASGEFITISVNESGIWSVRLTNLFNPGAVLEEYQPEDFISKNQLESIIDLARTSFYQELPNGERRSYRVESVELIYIPWLEKGNWVLLPAFSVNCISLYINDKGEIEESKQLNPMLIDAVSGYVYRL